MKVVRVSDVALAEDTTGTRHRSQAVGGEEAILATAQFPG
jgi:hypothetical protein